MSTDFSKLGTQTDKDAFELAIGLLYKLSDMLRECQDDRARVDEISCHLKAVTSVVDFLNNRCPSEALVANEQRSSVPVTAQGSTVVPTPAPTPPPTSSSAQETTTTPPPPVQEPPTSPTP